MTFYRCDRCKKEIDSGLDLRELQCSFKIYPLVEPFEVKAELCLDCVTKLRDWLKAPMRT